MLIIYIYTYVDYIHIYILMHLDFLVRSKAGVLHELTHSLSQSLTIVFFKYLIIFFQFNVVHGVVWKIFIICV